MPSFDRYHRQMLLPGIGEAGQESLFKSHALVVGCGALGSVIADTLTRAGVGTISIIDRDIVEITNLQRQILFDESDVETGMPKAEAAKAKLPRINSNITIHAHVDDFNHTNAARFIDGVNIILDGLDNFETRYLINDLAVMHGLPYIYGGAVGTTGVSMPILPHATTSTSLSGRGLGSGSSARRITWEDSESTPCLRCIFPEAPPPGTSPTCDTAGVLGPIVSMIAAHQCAQAIKVMTGNFDALDRSLFSIDAWTNETQRFDVSNARENANCPCCVQRRFEFYDGVSASSAISMCGRNAVQISPSKSDGQLDLNTMLKQLANHGFFTCNDFLLRGEFTSERDADGNPIELTLFPTGRAILKGTTSPDTARSIYAKYIGT